MPHAGSPNGFRLTGLFLAAAAVALPQPAAALDPLGPPQAVSPAVSPFAGCTADNVGGQPGINYPNTAIEPYVDAQPNNPAVVIAAWQQDRWSNGGARGLVAGYRTGGTWHVSIPPGVSRCTGGRYVRASDPWVSISPNGTAYFMSLAFDPDLPDGRFGANAMLVNRSRDGGASWGRPIVLGADRIGPALNDKNSLTADPVDSRFAYAAWDRIVDFTLPPALRAGGARGARLRAEFLRNRAAAARAVPGGRKAPTPIYFEGPTYFTRTTDGGAGWGKPRIVFDPGPNAQTINNLVEVGSHGRVHLFFTHIDDTGRVFLEVMTSHNHGRQFPHVSRRIAQTFSFGSLTPDEFLPVRDGAILFDTAIDRATGRLYIVWQDLRFSGVEEVAFSQSTNGKKWSAPIRINRTPANANLLRQQAIIPQIEVLNGSVVVTYYDFRNDDATGELADAWIVRCAASCSSRGSWAEERRLTPTSFDYAKAPFARGLFLGDYVGLTVAGGAAIPVFGVTTAAPNSADVVARPVTAN